MRPKNPKRQEAGRAAAVTRRTRREKALDEMRALKANMASDPEPEPPAASEPESPATSEPAPTRFNPIWLGVGVVGAVGAVGWYMYRRKPTRQPARAEKVVPLKKERGLLYME
jgi:ferric-dicitrate binding protein FerR (iron transport regulator)